MGKKAVFLDRDGTINEDVGYLYKIEDLSFISGAIEGMRILQKKYLLLIITNQQGISQNVFSEADLLAFNDKYLTILEKHGINVAEIYFCPHAREDNCICRKPGTYLIEKAEMKYDLDLNGSFIVGDHQSDIETGLNIGLKTVYVLSGHGLKDLDGLTVKPDHIAEDLYRAALWIDNKTKEEL